MEGKLHQNFLELPPFQKCTPPPPLLDDCIVSHPSKGILKIITNIPPGTILPAKSCNHLGHVPLMTTPNKRPGFGQ